MPEFKMTEVEPTPYLYAEESSSMEPAEISAAMGRAFGTVMGHMQENAIAPAGPALSVYYGYDPAKMDFRAGFVVTEGDLEKAGGAVKADRTPAGRVVHFTHVGPYEKLRDSYGELMAWMEREGLSIGAPSWEVYVNDPDSTPEEELLTEIYVTVT